MRLLSPGFLTAIEGIDGAGKTTQAQRLHDLLQKQQIKTLRTREPTDGPWGKLLRESAQTGRLSLDEELETFIKDRKEHVQKVIKPALLDGAIVIMDRYYFSNAAYQGARGLDPEMILRRNEEFAPEPDLLILINISPQIGLERVQSRGNRADLFESNNALQRAQTIFQGIRRPYLVRVEGSHSPDVTHLSILEALARALTEKIAANHPANRSGLEAALRALQNQRGSGNMRGISP